MKTEEIQEQIQNKDIRESLEFLAGLFPGQVAFSSSLGLEDQVITHVIFSNQIPVNVFTIDTGRLFNETYELIQVTEAKYNQRIKIYTPDTEELENLVSQHGINCFYQSVDLRKKCCHVRKVVPLRRALKDVRVWVTGLRAAQSENRNNVKVLEWDNTYNLLKYNPLVHWGKEEVSKYIAEFSVPYNSLHEKGFPSIGCAPCTRAVFAGEDIRAGRWWWEESKKECGLHERPVDFQI
jgi:phosphoadenosine phosphosulfate reductase